MRSTHSVATVRLVHVTTVPMSLTFLRGQVGYMKERGFSVEVVSSPGPDLTTFGNEEEVPAHAVRMHRSLTPLRDVLAVLKLCRILSRSRPHVVHAHTPKAGLLGMLAAWFVRVPVRIYHMRGLPLAGATGWRRRLLWSTEWFACRLAHRVLCVGHSLRRDAIAEGLVSPEKIHVLAGGSGNGVDALNRFDITSVGEAARRTTRDALGVPDDAPLIGFVGRIVNDKGIVELTRAWTTLRVRHPSARLLLVGPFEPQDPVPPDVAAILRTDPRVHLQGMDWNTPPLYAAMDLVVLPTYREGFPNVPLEAAAMELPVVATRVPGCVDAVEDGVTGTLVPVRDDRALHDALDRYLSAPELRREHGLNGRERVVRDFGQREIWQALYQEYLALLRSRGLEFSTPYPIEKEGDR